MKVKLCPALVMELKVAVIVLFLAVTTFAAPYDSIYGSDNERKEPSAWETLKEGAKNVFNIGNPEHEHHPIETHHDYHHVEYPADTAAQRAVQESQRVAEQVAHMRRRRRAEEQKESPRTQNQGSSSGRSEGLPPQGALEIMYKQQKERENKPQPTFIEELKSGWEKVTVIPPDTADRMGEKWEETKEKSRETLDQAKQKVAEGWDATKEGAANAGEKIKEAFSRDKNTKIAIPPAQQPQ